jgi:Na+-translocating ferredoxin:NAD+ oxidoreductase RnfG subunit
MKGVFNRPALMLVLVAISSSLAASGHAQVYYSVRGLLAEQFRQRIQLSSERREEIERHLGQKLEKQEYIFYVAHSADHVDGYALFDREIGQHEYIDVATFFDGRGKVTRVEVVAYREPYGDGIRSRRFRKQFVGKAADSGFKPGHDIDVISGATLSARAMAKAVKRATLLLHDTVLTSS